MIHLIREGTPVGKARARTTSKGGKTWGYTPDKTADAEEEWKWLFVEKGYQPFLEDVPLSLTVIATMPNPMKTPDIDNICKLIGDALKGMAYKNDSQIVHLVASKVKGKPPKTEIWLTDKLSIAAALKELEEMKHE